MHSKEQQILDYHAIKATIVLYLKALNLYPVSPDFINRILDNQYDLVEVLELILIWDQLNDKIVPKDTIENTHINYRKNAQWELDL